MCLWLLYFVLLLAGFEWVGFGLVLFWLFDGGVCLGGFGVDLGLGLDWCFCFY